MVNQLRHTNWKMAQNLQYQTYVFFCPCVVRNSNAHVDTKVLNMSHHSQKWFWGIFVGISQHQKGYLFYVPSKRKIFSSHDVVFDENNYSELAYTPCPYSEALAMQPSVSYIPYATSSYERTDYIITFSHFEERGLVEK